MSLILKKNDAPTLFNKDMVLGGLAAAAATFFTGGTFLVGGAIIGGGALIGGFLGEKRMEREAIEGKVVGEPSFWNKDTLIGGLIGGISAPIVAGIGALVAAALVAVVAPASPAILGAAVLGLAVGGAGAIATGTYIGGKMGESRMANELNDARQQNIVNELSKSSGPQVAQAVEYAMANDKTKNWTQHIENERALATGQAHQHGK